MKKGDFEFLIVSSHLREKVSCELYYKGEIIAEIAQEEKLVLELYPTHRDKWWIMPFDEFADALESARNHLINKPS